MGAHPLPGSHLLVALVVAVVWAAAALCALFLGPDPPAASMRPGEWAVLGLLTVWAVLCAVLIAWAASPGVLA